MSRLPSAVSRISHCLVCAKPTVIHTFLLLHLLFGAASAQTDPAAGILPYSTHVGGPIDSLDLATGNIVITIPVRNKIGAIPFRYSLGVNSHAYYWVAGKQNLITMGLLSQGMSFNASLTWSSYDYTCTGHPYTKAHTGFAVTDPTGGVHSLVPPVTAAPYCNPLKSPQTVATTDGSGYTAVISPVQGQLGFTYVIYDASGNNVSGQPWSDPDGNTINGSNGFTDTLGATGVMAGGGTTAQQTYQWTDIGGNPQVLTVNNAQYTFNAPAGCGPPYPGTYLPSNVVLPDNTQYTFTYQTYQNGITGRIAQITLPNGGYVSYTYDTPCSYGPATRTVSDGNGHVSTWKYSGWILAQTSNTPIIETDPAGNQTVRYFSGEYLTQANYYQGGCPVSISSACAGGGTSLKTVTTCYGGNFSGGLSGCQSATVTLFSQEDVYTTLYGPGSQSSTNLVETKVDSWGNTIEVKQYDFGATAPPTGNPILDTVTSYGQSWNGAACTSYAAGTYIRNTPCYSHTKNSSGQDVAATQITYSNTGHPLSTKRWTSGSSWLTSTSVYNPNGTIQTTTAPNGAIFTYAYNGTGGCNNLLPTSVTVTGAGLPPGGLTKSSQWDCNGGVLTQISDENGQVTKYGYINQAGIPDPFWRLLSVTDPLGNVTWSTYASATQSTPASVETYLNFPASNPTSTVDNLNILDGLGRVMTSEERTAPGATSFDHTVQYTYGWQSSTAACTTQPPFTTGACKTQTIPGGSAITTTQNDALGRLLSVTDGGGGTQTYAYSQNDILITVGPAPAGERVKQVQKEYDGLGRLTKSCAIGNGSSTACGQKTGSANGVTTSFSYTYPASGTQISTVTATRGVQSRSTSYDSTGRVTQVVTPEGGTWSFTYDATVGTASCGWSTTPNLAGRLSLVSDPKGDQLCYSYDALGRATQVYAINTSANTKSCRHFYYDSQTGYSGSIPSGVSTPTYPNNRMIEAATDSCSSSTLGTDEWLSYDIDGRVQDMWEMTPHSGQYYHSKATFQGNDTTNIITALQLAAPSLYTMTWTLDGEGRWNTLTDTTASKSLITGPTTGGMYDAAGRVLNVQLTGTTPDQDIYTYDPNTGRMNTFEFEVGNTPANLTGTLTWNQNGTLSSLHIADGFNRSGSQTCNSNSSGSGGGYDDWGRLVGFDCGSGNWGQQYSYDNYDNLSKSVLSGRTGTTWNPGYSATTNHYACSGCTYDSNGNVTYDGNYVYGWDEFSKLKWTATSGTPTCGSSGGCAVYDAFGRMVEQSNGSSWTERWITQLSETAYMTGSTISWAYWPAPGTGTVLIAGNGSSFNYMHKDWLGSARITSDLTNHTITDDVGYTPFGEVYQQFGTNYSSYYEFAGMFENFDPAVMRDTPNRELSYVGRWLSPDPWGNGAVDLSKAQDWNRYAYVLNNPLSYTDPLGLQTCPYGAHSYYGTFICNAPPATPWVLNMGCKLNGVPVPCNMAFAALRGGAAVICPYEDCNNRIRQDLENGQWEILVGYRPRTALNLNGTSYQTFSPIWVDYVPLPSNALFTDLYSTDLFKPGPPPMPIVTAIHPPAPPPKPGRIECLTNPGDTVEEHTRNADQPHYDPDFPNQIYIDGNQGVQQGNPQGQRLSEGIAIVIKYLINNIGCNMIRVFGK